ncbi:hypothetical protein VTJ83DRAFT_2852 [Remersonia thermophila]|uniref:Mannose-1-phosphate guanylyltransferase n=1 Tax=Remersonia thermophila TaxID=72144 RepID=A0ABR4DCE1_9PEZI
MSSSESTIITNMSPEPELEPEHPRHYREVIFPAGNPDFRAVRNRCAQACREFNKTPDDADPEHGLVGPVPSRPVRPVTFSEANLSPFLRIPDHRYHYHHHHHHHYHHHHCRLPPSPARHDAPRPQLTLNPLSIVRPDRDRTEDSALAITHDQTFTNPTLKARTPFVKPPVYVDYGVRLHVGGSTFINRNCTIMDTPVADVVIGERCNIGPNCVIVGVTHPVRLDERLQRNSVGQPVTIGDDVWIGANVTILGNVTIGSGSVIGAGSLVKRNIPPMSVAFGVPARVVAYLRDVKPTPPGSAPIVPTLEEALALQNRLDIVHADEQDMDGARVDNITVVEGQVGPAKRRGMIKGLIEDVADVPSAALELLDSGLLADDVPVAAEAQASRLLPRRAFGLVSPAPAVQPLSPSPSPSLPPAGAQSRFAARCVPGGDAARDRSGDDLVGVAAQQRQAEWEEERPISCRCAHSGVNHSNNINNNHRSSVVNGDDKFRNLLRLRSPRCRRLGASPLGSDDPSPHESDDDDDDDDSSDEVSPGDSLLHRRRRSHRQRQRRRRHCFGRFDVQAIAVVTVIVIMSAAVGFAVAYLWASASAAGGGNHHNRISNVSRPGLRVGADADM